LNLLILEAVTVNYGKPILRECGLKNIPKATAVSANDAVNPDIPDITRPTFL
jgi:hypothetical protein